MLAPDSGVATLGTGIPDPLTTGTYADVESHIYIYLKKSGYSVAVICGILANIEKECGFNPDAWNRGEKAYGICQWRGSRLNDLAKFVGKNYLEPPKYADDPLGYSNKVTVESQVKFIDHELNNKESNARKKLEDVIENAQGAYNAGYAFSMYYERPSGGSSTATERGNLARDKYWPHYSGETGAPNREDITVNDEDTDTPGGGNTSGDFTDSTAAIDYIALTSIDPYAEIMETNLSEIQAEGYQYGYLIDMDRGESFAFYVPEFEESAGANWSPIDIRGRSVSIQSYESTSSRKITISLDLYAGEGIYKVREGSGESGEDTVSRLHRDANFVKSLEYPDYSNVILRPPSTVHLILGAAINFAGVVQGVTVNHLKPVDQYNRSMYIKLSFTVVQTTTNPPDYRDIRSGNYHILNTPGMPGLAGSPDSNANVYADKE